MSRKKAHLWLGLSGFAVFLATGIYMRMGFPELYGSNEVIRYAYRANPIYVLLASLINLVLGLYFRPAFGWKKKLATAGSVLLLLAPVVLVNRVFCRGTEGNAGPLAHLGRYLHGPFRGDVPFAADSIGLNPSVRSYKLLRSASGGGL